MILTKDLPEKNGIETDKITFQIKNNIPLVICWFMDFVGVHWGLLNNALDVDELFFVNVNVSVVEDVVDDAVVVTT